MHNCSFKIYLIQAIKPGTKLWPTIEEWFSSIISMTTSKSVKKLSELVSWLASPTKSALHLCKCVYVEPKGGIPDEAEHESEVPQPDQNSEVVLEEVTPRDTANLLVWRMCIRFVNDFMKHMPKSTFFWQKKVPFFCKIK